MIENLNESTENALFYVKFRSFAPRLKVLINELEKRAEGRKEFFFFFFFQSK